MKKLINCVDCNKELNTRNKKTLRCVDCYRIHMKVEDKFCMDCGKQIDANRTHVKRCWDCHILLRNIDPAYNGNFKNKIFECDTCGKELSHRGENTTNCYECHLEFIKKQVGVCIDCGQVLSKSTFQRCKNCDTIFKGRNKPKCIDCGKLISHGSIRCKPCSSKHMSGKNHYMYGKQVRCNFGYYKDTWMRSSWELNFAKWCDLSNIEWFYEPKAFELGNTTYTPDFYLPEFDLWIEIKGYWRYDAKKKFTKFKRLFKDINIEIFNKEKLLNMSIIK